VKPAVPVHRMVIVSRARWRTGMYAGRFDHAEKR
jgi:hypothetical protein